MELTVNPANGLRSHTNSSGFRAIGYTPKAPDGSYVGGTPQMAPDGSYVGGTPQMAPDGSWIGRKP